MGRADDLDGRLMYLGYRAGLEKNRCLGPSGRRGAGFEDYSYDRRNLEAGRDQEACIPVFTGINLLKALCRGIIPTTIGISACMLQ